MCPFFSKEATKLGDLPLFRHGVTGDISCLAFDASQGMTLGAPLAAFTESEVVALAVARALRWPRTHLSRAVAAVRGSSGG